MVEYLRQLIEDLEKARMYAQAWAARRELERILQEGKI